MYLLTVYTVIIVHKYITIIYPVLRRYVNTRNIIIQILPTFQARIITGGILIQRFSVTNYERARLIIQ